MCISFCCSRPNFWWVLVHRVCGLGSVAPLWSIIIDWRTSVSHCTVKWGWMIDTAGWETRLVNQFGTCALLLVSIVPPPLNPASSRQLPSHYNVAGPLCDANCSGLLVRSHRISLKLRTSDRVSDSHSKNYLQIN